MLVMKLLSIYMHASRAVERDTLMKLGYATGEADKSHRRAAQVIEQLGATRLANSELQAELRRVKVYSDPWRKAAEAAASILSTRNNVKLIQRRRSLGSNYSPNTMTISPCHAEDMDYDFLKKVNGNMLKKIGVLGEKTLKSRRIHVKALTHCARQYTNLFGD